jgi:hypothetical protein
MFAEDEQLLPLGIFTDLLKHAGSDTDKAARRIDKLFTAMQKKAATTATTTSPGSTAACSNPSMSRP